MTRTEFPFLQGRGFVFASQYSKVLQLQSAQHYLDAAVQVLELNEAGIPVKISAMKAVHKYVPETTDIYPVMTLFISFCQGGDDSALIPFAPRIAEDVGPFLLVTSEDTLVLALETLAVVIDIDQGKWLTPELAQSLVNAVLEAWSKNNKGSSSSFC